ncbi:MAG: hypothetical protein FJY85_23920, partial [Deltaproteobacteria bacterium]|nr:hypothetical protein [Deltaproteobacteria bacterium]
KPSELKTKKILQSYPFPQETGTIELLKQSLRRAGDSSDSERLERILFGCMDLAIERQTALLAEMLRVFMQGGRMHVGAERIPALEVVPWLQSQTDFDKREEMRKENSIFLKAVVNPVLLSILDLSVRTVTEAFGFENYARYSEAKKRISFNLQAKILLKYLEDTRETYFRLVVPWVRQAIGRPFDHLSRYHALYMVRIRQFDHYFPVSRLRGFIEATYEGLGFDLRSRPDVIIDTSDNPSKSSAGICLGVEIPGEVHVIMKPVNGLIDIETLLHETGHAFFLSHFNSELPVEYRRLFRSGALDETFAFLFMNLIENGSWLTSVVGIPEDEAAQLAHLVRVKRLCLIRRYIGKFLAEKEL